MIQLLFQLAIVVICVFAGVAFLMTLGVRFADRQDYFSLENYTSTIPSSLAGGLVPAVAALSGFGGPMLLFRRSGKFE